MSRTKEAIVRKVDSQSAQGGRAVRLRLTPTPTPEPALPALATARIEAIEGDRIRVAIGGQSIVATRDESVHPTVLAGAAQRRERVLCERGPDGAWTILGALRSQPIPGIDVAESYAIEADRVEIRGKSEVSITTAAAGIAVRAIGEVESYAERILSRAEGVHKIVGRILRLN